MVDAVNIQYKLQEKIIVYLILAKQKKINL